MRQKHYFIQVNDQIYTGVEQTIAGSVPEFDIFVNCMNVITNQDTWCPEVVTHFTEVIDQYDVTHMFNLVAVLTLMMGQLMYNSLTMEMLLQMPFFLGNLLILALVKQ